MPIPKLKTRWGPSKSITISLKLHTLGLLIICRDNFPSLLHIHVCIQTQKCFSLDPFAHACMCGCIKASFYYQGNSILIIAVIGAERLILLKRRTAFRQQCRQVLVLQSWSASYERHDFHRLLIHELESKPFIMRYVRERPWCSCTMFTSQYCYVVLCILSVSIRQLQGAQVSRCSQPQPRLIFMPVTN